MGHGKSCLFLLVVVLVLLPTTTIRATTEPGELKKHDHPSTVTEKIAEEIDDRRREGEEVSWTTWAKDKIFGGLGFRHHDDSAMKHGEEVVGKAKDNLLHTTSEAGEKAGETVQGSTGTASDAAKKGMGKIQEVLSDAGEYITGKAGEGKKAAKDAACKAKDAVEKAACEAKQKATESEEKLRWAKEKAQEGYDAVKQKSEEVKEKIKDSTKHTSEEL